MKVLPGKLTQITIQGKILALDSPLVEVEVTADTWTCALCMRPTPKNISVPYPRDDGKFLCSSCTRDLLFLGEDPETYPLPDPLVEPRPKKLTPRQKRDRRKSKKYGPFNWRIKKPL